MRGKVTTAALTDEQVREIKANLVLGVTVSALARRWDVSAETISRIRRGLTYKHVVVKGEEGLRPEVRVEAPTERFVAVHSGISDEDAAASLEKLMELMKADPVAEIERAAQSDE